MSENRVKIVISASAKGVKTVVGGVRQTIQRTTAAVFSLQGALVGLGGGLLAKSFLDTAAAMERMGVQLVTIQGSAAAAKQSMGWITEFAATTPYDIDQVAQSFVKLEAYGFKGTQWMGMLGDTASSMGKSLEQAVEMFADAVTCEFERLKDFGVKASIQGDQVSFHWSENGQDMVISTEKTQSGISSALDQVFDRFEGGMGRMSTTWIGMVSNLGDAWTMFKVDVMNQDVFVNLKAGIKTVLDLLVRWKKDGEMSSWAQSLARGMNDAFGVIVKGAYWVGRAFLGWKIIWEGLKIAWDATQAAIWTGMSWLVDAIADVIEKYSKVKGFFGMDTSGADQMVASLREFTDSATQTADLLIDDIGTKGVAGLHAAVDNVALLDQAAAELTTAWEENKEALLAQGEATGETAAKTNKGLEQAQKNAANAAKEQTALNQALNEVSMAVLPKQEQAVERVKRQYAALEDQVWLLFEAEKISSETAEEWMEKLGDRQTEALAGLEQSHEETAEKAVNIWEHSFERITDALADMIYEFDFSFTAIGDIMRRSASQYAASMIMSPAQGAMFGGGTVAAGGGMSAPMTGFTGFGSMFSNTSLAGFQESAAWMLSDMGFDSAAYFVDGLSNGVFGGLTAGIGTTALSFLSGNNTGQAVSGGVGAGLGFAVGGPVGALVGGVAGDLFGGAVFGNDEPRSTRYGEIAQYDYDPITGLVNVAGSNEVNISGYHSRGTASSGSDFSAQVAGSLSSLTTTFEAMGEAAGFSEERIRSMFDAVTSVDTEGQRYSASTGSNLATSYFHRIKDDGDFEYWWAENMSYAAEGVIAPFVESFAGMMRDPAILDLSGFTGDMADKLTSTFSDALALMEIDPQGDMESELAQVDTAVAALTNVFDYIAQAADITAQIDESMDASRLSREGLALKKLVAGYDQMEDVLHGLGVEVDKTNLGLARQADIQALVSSVTDPYQNIITRAGQTDKEAAISDLTKWFRDEKSKLLDLGKSWDSDERELLNQSFIIQMSEIYSATSMATDSIKDQVAEVMHLNDWFNGTVESTANLSAALDHLYVTELAALDAINAAIIDINSTFANSVETIQLAMMTDAERYAHFSDKASNLFSSLAEMTDPAAISATMSEINASAMSAWSLLDDGQQQTYGADFIDFMQESAVVAGGRLGEIETSILNNHTNLMGELAGSFEGSTSNLEGTSERLEAAAERMEAAAILMAESSNITVSLSGAGEVGY